MNPYKTSAITLISMLALAGCPSDDTGGDTDSGSSDTDPTATATATMTATETATETATATDTDSGTDTDPDTTDTDTDTDTDTAADGAAIRVIHASPGAPAVDVWVMGDDAPVIEGLAYGETSDYLDVPAGDYTFEIRVAGDGGDVDPVFTTDALTLAEGDSISAIAAGQVGGDGDAAFRVLALADGFEDAGAGNAAVRVVHAGSDAPAVDIDVGNDGKVELPGVAPYADSGAEGVPLPSGEALQVGILADGAPVTAFTTPELPEGAPLYVIATGLLADLPRVETGFSLLAVGPDGSIGFIAQNPRIYALHAGSDAPNVDICVAGAPLLEDVPFGAMGGVQVEPGSYDLDIHATGDAPCDGDPAFTAAGVAAEAGQQYLAVAQGELTPEDGEPAFTVGLYVENFALDNDPGDAVAKVIHGAAAPDVNIGLVTSVDDTQITADNVLVTGLGFGEETGRDILVTDDAIIVGIGDAADNQPPYDVIANFEVTTPDSIRAWVVATGSLAPDGEEAGFALHAVVTSPGAWALLGPIPGVDPN